MTDDIDRETGEIRQAVVAQPEIKPMASASCAQVFGALAIAQGKFEAPKRTKQNPFFKSTYAPLEEIERVIRGPLAENGLMRLQYLVSRGGQPFIRTIIGHTSGEWIASDYPVYAGDNRNQAQAFASGVTYARRYGLSLALGICPEDDDDAQLAGSGEAKKPASKPRQPIGRDEGSATSPQPEDREEPSPSRSSLISRAELEAAYGLDHFSRWWSTTLDKDLRKLIGEKELRRLKMIAAKADAARRETPGAAPQMPAEPEKGDPETHEPPGSNSEKYEAPLQVQGRTDAAGNPITIMDAG
jgi:hypothetical protein